MPTYKGATSRYVDFTDDIYTYMTMKEVVLSVDEKKCKMTNNPIADNVHFRGYNGEGCKGTMHH